MPFSHQYYEQRQLREYLRERDEALGRVILHILKIRGITLSHDERDLIATSKDWTCLLHWQDRARTANIAADLFAGPYPWYTPCR